MNIGLYFLKRKYYSLKPLDMTLYRYIIYVCARVYHCFINFKESHYIDSHIEIFDSILKKLNNFNFF